MNLKNIFSVMLCLCAFCAPMKSENYLLSTPNTSLLLSATKGGNAQFQYYGIRIEEDQISQIFNARLAFYADIYPVFGIETTSERAMQVTHPDGNMSLDMVVDAVEQKKEDKAQVIRITLKDKIYPFMVTVCYKAYTDCDIIETWTEITNNEKKPVTMYQFASAYVPMRLNDNWLSHFHGTWGSEAFLYEEKLTPGQKLIKNRDGVRNAMQSNPSFMLTTNGKATEDDCNIYGGSLAWSGNYSLKFDLSTNHRINLFAGINEDASQYVLEPKETFITPELALTFSTQGKGGISRNFHRWARLHKLGHGDQNRDILLNSWEGVYMNVNQSVMDQMMKDFSEMGGELFVMDDGWFGDKYPRDKDNSSLGDWVVCKKKLPEGVEGLIASAKKYGIKFGIWIEPEMVNSISELYEKHPNWIICQDNREPQKGRGGTQMVLDLSNPEVQDFVFGVVDGLMTNYPELAYIKWDANASVMNYGSYYLPKNKQSQLYIEYHKGLRKVLERIRAKYPNLIMQACASGGGRVNYGLLPYFDEFWTSDNTDALQRLYMQWGISHFYPSLAMASHVSADRNHQTGRTVPLKFRFDVAMTGRLGMEIQPKNMTDKDKSFAKQAIETYKSIRLVVQQGDLYRLVSPFDNKGYSALMYATEQKDRAVFFVYKIDHFVNQVLPRVKLTGLDPQKTYKLKEINTVGKSKYPMNDKEIKGEILMTEGIELFGILGSEYASVVVELNEVK